jgi:Tfp pilus assembly protein PilF
MIRSARRLILSLFVVLAAGCAGGPLKDVPNPFAKDTGKPILEEGLRDYEDGNYRSAGRKIKSALDEGLRAKADRVTAHKYLAFVHCVSNRKVQCREEFVLAMEIDPKFTLTPAEAGHPVWGPVYRSVKERAP